MLQDEMLIQINSGELSVGGTVSRLSLLWPAMFSFSVIMESFYYLFNNYNLYMPLHIVEIDIEVLMLAVQSEAYAIHFFILIIN